MRLTQLATSNELEVRIEKKCATHDEAIAAILTAIRQLMNPL